MKLRILQHEKSSDNIRIGAEFYKNDRPLSDIETEVRGYYLKNDCTDMGKYWSRIAIVEADTLAIVALIYKEPK